VIYFGFLRWKEEVGCGDKEELVHGVIHGSIWLAHDPVHHRPSVNCNLADGVMQLSMLLLPAKPGYQSSHQCTMLLSIPQLGCMISFFKAPSGC